MMQNSFLSFLARWFVTAVAVLAASKLVNGIAYADYGSLAVAALLLGIINALVRPVLLFITLPVNVLTLGLFTLVINGALFLLVGRVVRGFYVADFWAAFWGAIVVSIVSFLVGTVVRGGERGR
ncbi:MAG: phage holin family protein [Verrucomicrobia bacterium]|nr:phage holin family protein [Verrucomicrobiota bacterium]